MGFLELLTIIFVVLKLVGTIDWNWWVVLSPTLLSVTLYAVWFVVWLFIARKTVKTVNKEFNDDFFKFK